MSPSAAAAGRDLFSGPRLVLRGAAVSIRWCSGRLKGRGLVVPASFLPLLILSTFFFPALGTAEILVEPRIGFHGVFQLGRPFPLEVELHNSGPPTEGTLVITVWKGGATKGGVPYPLYYRRTIFLPARARKTVQLTIDPDFISRPLKIAFLSPAATAS
ncbi:MAG TPA: hypothetical protein VLD83_14260, partial [Candidatus Binatia bacterium]|nr:hypothetical protein [Candidatus Binatia bacterium]